MRKLLPLIVSLGFVSFAQAHAVPAADAAGAAHVDRDPAAMRHDGISMEEAKSRAARQTGAQALNGTVQDEDGRKVYVIKLMKDGRVFFVRVDAASGRVL
ncbi:MAG TPA: PepSY domain-containing protein [Steroidobacteraceae bacterium]|nr:PepSY domain-containing protein [Steroidobacteraceae bacterium]